MARLTRRGVVLAALLTFLMGTTQAWAAGWTVQSTPNGGTRQNYLFSVTTNGPGSAWAVGDYSISGGFFRTLIEHYNGAKWVKQTSPDPSSKNDYLYGVKLSSSTSVWAVGTYGVLNSSKTLILHDDGSSWTRQSSPSPNDQENLLSDVSATSDTNAWAVGYDGHLSGSSGALTSPPRPSPLPQSVPFTGLDTNTLIEHYDGTSWKIQKSVNPGPADNYLLGDGSLGPSSSWAAGFIRNAPGGPGSTLIEHYDGTKWSRQSTPNPGGAFGTGLNAVSPDSSTDIWAVGSYYTCAAQECQRGLILHNDGTGWKVAGKVQDGLFNGLNDVKATSPTDVWAVGFSINNGVQQTMVLHYDGAHWSFETSPNVGQLPNDLYSVGATSPSSAFAVGVTATNSTLTKSKTLAMSCC
jgi:photosystem II stability/assembly factor-like uncharacterized protein